MQQNNVNLSTASAQIEDGSIDLLTPANTSTPVKSQLKVGMMAFTGPLPPPQALKGYEDVIPGGAERIFSMAEREQTHRHNMESESLNGKVSREKRGQWMGLGITVLIIVIASLFAYRGDTLFAGTLIGIDLISLVAIFVVGIKASSPKEAAPSLEPQP